MAILNILNYPDPRLYTVAKPVKQVDADIKRLIADMAETMYDSRFQGGQAVKQKR